MATIKLISLILPIFWKIMDPICQKSQKINYFFFHATQWNFRFITLQIVDTHNLTRIYRLKCWRVYQLCRKTNWLHIYEKNVPLSIIFFTCWKLHDQFVKLIIFNILKMNTMSKSIMYYNITIINITYI